ncbi:acyl-CoA dehydrogenase family protein [Roseomonas sp. PWR1]|uniref:Acyl-CoA dehydrogenase family protein n=1 Tax=Roseomonas nitratireducens TaxID=2820810 RepID=A0ABS4AUX9_9PROT|nr:acyl-CoA dehydrogenase family protein [Neoroseomonas nitratireducens]MBP0465112.1 acyl-CoA dehydrogenase family protein [Neoroseomonas nitratireducens]
MIRDAAAQAARLAAARRLVDDILIPAEARMDEEDRMPEPARAALRAHGLFGISIPEAHGGLGLTMEEEAGLMLVLGRAAPAYRAVYALNSGGAAQILLRAGTGAQKARWLPGLARGDLIACFCLSEPEAGSDAASLTTRAVRDGDGWRITGRKRWVTNAPEAGMLMVMARTGGNGARGVSAFAIDPATPGIAILPAQAKMGMRGAAVADIAFEDARVPADALVGAEGEGLKLALAGLDKVRLHLAALCAGLMERMVEEGRRHALARRQFGGPIADQPAVAALLADSVAEALAARCLALDLARARDDGTLRPADAAAAKLFATEAACRVADRVLQVHGGEGYMRGAAIERLYRDVRLLRILDGTSEIQRMVVARALFSG